MNSIMGTVQANWRFDEIIANHEHIFNLTITICGNTPVLKLNVGLFLMNANKTPYLVSF